MTHQPEPWVHDNTTTACTECRLTFTIIRRRHHCRFCGLIFCGRCTPSKAWVPGCKEKVRVCDKCAEELSPAGFSRLLAESRAAASAVSGASDSLQASAAAVHLVRFAAELAEEQSTWAERLWAAEGGTLRECVNCGEARPEWIDVNHGVALCTVCAGTHRGFGVHVSRVRSLLFDALTPGERLSVLLGGNVRFAEAVGGGTLPIVRDVVRDSPEFAARVAGIFCGDDVASYRLQLQTLRRTDAVVAEMGARAAASAAAVVVVSGVGSGGGGGSEGSAGGEEVVEKKPYVRVEHL